MNRIANLSSLMIGLMAVYASILAIQDLNHMTAPINQPKINGVAYSAR